MPLAVVVVPSGGLPVTEAAVGYGTPMVEATNGYGMPVTFATSGMPVSGISAFIPGSPVNTVAPVISGTTTIGSVLSCTTGTWSPAATSYAYLWRRNGAPISGGTASTYTLAAADNAAAMTCRVIASNAIGPSVSIVSNTLTLADVTPVNTVAPVISGALTSGSVLTSTTGSWTNTPSSYTYQWTRNGAAISGATASTYTLVVADEATSVVCQVIAVKSGVNSAVANSNTLSIPAAGGTIDGLSGVTLTSGIADNAPDFEFDLPLTAEAGWVVSAQSSPTGAGVWTSYFDHTLTAPEITADIITVAGIVPLADGTYDFRFRLEDGIDVSAWSSVNGVVIHSAPQISTLSPTNGASNVTLTDNLVVTFDKSIQFGTGDINVYKTSGDVLFENFDVVTHAGTKLTIAGAVLTINPASPLDASTAYYVQIDPTAIQNTGSVPFAGVADETTWTFTSAASSARELKIDTYFSDATWTAPANIVDNVALKVELWGAGGSSVIDTGSGGGAAYSRGENVAVTPSTGYAVIVGDPVTGATGEDSTFATTTVVAKGGKYNVAGASAGGQAADCTGTVAYSGAAGGMGTGVQGGGPAAGDGTITGATGNASGATIGGARNGGGGGAVTTGTPWGGGARSTASTAGLGGKGHARVTYQVPATAGYPYCIARQWNRETANTTSRNIVYPAGIASGDLIIVACGTNISAVAVRSITGYTSLDTDSNTTTTNLGGTILWRRANGSETAGSTVALTCDVTSATNWVMHVFRSAGDPQSISTNGNSALPDALSLAMTGGDANKACLFLTTILQDSSVHAPPISAPSGYNNIFIQPAGYGWACHILVAEKRVAAGAPTTENPGTMSLFSTDQWLAFTVGIPFA